LGEFLEAGFEIAEFTGGILCGGDGHDYTVDNASGLVETAVEVDSSENGFDCVGEEGAFLAATGEFFAASELEAVAEVDGAGDADEMGGGDDAGLVDAEVAFGEFGVVTEEVFADQEAENGIAEEFELFVVFGHGLAALAAFTVEAAMG